MKKIFYFLFLLIFVNLAANAQQDPQFSFNKEAQLSVNPGFAGSNDAITGLILNRYQWSGFDGTPKTLLFSVETTANIFGSTSGVGLNIISDELGFSKNVLVNLNYSYQTTTSIGNLGIGTSLGMFNKSINGEWITVGEDGILGNATGDRLIPQSEVSQITFDVGLGLYLKSNDYFAGLSVTHVNQGEIKYGDGGEYFPLLRHYYLSAGYNISLPDPLFELRPSVFAKSDLASTQVDFNLSVVYNNRFSGGLTYRLQDAIALLIGVELKNGLNLGLAYDVTTSALGRYGYGSQEIFLRYSVDIGKGRLKKYKSIRFL
ncbi:PorP/SprF family type IX secretion system membrane protein [Sunxiuqinia indica]|uniref:PorP/SprF family type IX secretion system membrane protein n=1 Tax=Sunxiuqinia indica TaxID=2692584 RepID=UPI001357EA3D|nr:type IX secretion system membrane protein PorP/SprF [Sunxiuqinia indica]